MHGIDLINRGYEDFMDEAPSLGAHVEFPAPLGEPGGAADARQGLTHPHPPAFPGWGSGGHPPGRHSMDKLRALGAHVELPAPLGSQVEPPTPVRA